MKPLMSKTAAIRLARGHCALWGRRTSWTVSGPWDSNNPRGPVTEISADSYTKAARMRTVWRACIALAYMGRLTADTSHAVDWAADYGHDHSLPGLVEVGLRAWEGEQ